MRRPYLAVAIFLLSLLAVNFKAAQAQTDAVAPGSPPAGILVLGDSLSAEYGLARDTGWVKLLEQRLQVSHPHYAVVNASISGDTTSGGVARLPALLKTHQPQIVIIELGGNDALRGLQPTMTKTNLETLTRTTREAGAQPVIVGMQIPPNYGRAYAERFRAMFAEVAEHENAELVPFLLEGIATDDDMFQDDRIHPTAEAQPTLLNNVWPILQPLLTPASQAAAH